MSAGKRSARYLHHNRVKLIPGGTPYFSLLENMIADDHIKLADRFIRVQQIKILCAFRVEVRINIYRVVFNIRGLREPAEENLFRCNM